MPRNLLELAEAWRDPDAWTGMTAAGGVELAGDVAGVIALDELVIHGWDVAKSTNQPAGYHGPGLDEVHDRIKMFRTSGIEGLYGAEVPIPEEAPLLERTSAWPVDAPTGRRRAERGER